MQRAGTITAGIGLIGLGLCLLIPLVFPNSIITVNPLPWWPSLLIGTGIEILIYRHQDKNRTIKIDPVLIIFLVGIWLSSICREAIWHIHM